MNNVTGDLAVATVVGKWNDAVDFGDGVWGQIGRSVSEMRVTVRTRLFARMFLNAEIIYC